MSNKLQQTTTSANLRGALNFGFIYIYGSSSDMSYRLTTTMASSAAAQLCDTIPAARLAGPSSSSRTPSPPPTSTTFVVPTLDKSSVESAWIVQPEQIAGGHEHDHEHGEHDHAKGPAPSQPPGRKLCVRHQRMADEGTNLKLQQVSEGPLDLACELLANGLRDVLL